MSQFQYVLRSFFSYIMTVLLDVLIVHPVSVIQSVFKKYVSKVHRSRHEGRYIKIMASTEDHETWFAAASKLDKLFGYETWRHDNKDKASSTTCNLNAVLKRLHEVRKVRATNNPRAAGMYLRSELHRNLMGISSPELYCYHTGTKSVIEEYIQEVVKLIEFVHAYESTDTEEKESGGVPAEDDEFIKIDFRKGPVWKKRNASHGSHSDGAEILSNKVFTPSPIHPRANDYVHSLLNFASAADKHGTFTNREKYELFKDTAQSYGRTALMLSGGAALGLYHTGVVKALWEKGVLPRVISGSSAGSIIAAMFCTRTDPEIKKVIEDPIANLCFDAFEKCDNAFDSVKVKLWRLLTQGAFMDVAVLAQCLRVNCQDMTFLEAYQRTGRVLNISVSAEKRQGDTGMILNYITAPDVVIWSAVCASCALKGMFASVQLMVKDKHSNITPYLEGQLWSDGSVPCDLPIERLSQLFNVNFYIVSQTNPHVIPFVKPPPSYKRHKGHEEASFLTRAWFRACTEANRWLNHLYYIGIIPNRLPYSIPLLLSQQTYQGHITILPIGSVTRAIPDFINIVANPTLEHMEFVISSGARKTWPHINHIRWVTEIERSLDRCLTDLHVTHLEEIQRVCGIDVAPSLQVQLLSLQRIPKALKSVLANHVNNNNGTITTNTVSTFGPESSTAPLTDEALECVGDPKTNDGAANKNITTTTEDTKVKRKESGSLLDRMEGASDWTDGTSEVY
eukprot:PhF_6_TR16980/c0_g1_i1/m.25673/K14674/TGL4; TAG lipase / steryl ester hydrolase / phospholipase A2 / LPA acyltransferase